MQGRQQSLNPFEIRAGLGVQPSQTERGSHVLIPLKSGLVLGARGLYALLAEIVLIPLKSGLVLGPRLHVRSVDSRVLIPLKSGLVLGTLRQLAPTYEQS